jgi:hypothetical protein
MSQLFRYKSFVNLMDKGQLKTGLFINGINAKKGAYGYNYGYLYNYGYDYGMEELKNLGIK